jgi:hypothetical protein
MTTLKKKIKEITEQRQIAGLQESVNRARSITVGTAFGGVTEISMRTDGGGSVWCIMQPVEVTELIHQLAANIGCHINLQPRKDFASWRNWHYTEEDLKHFRGEQALPGVGHPPHANDLVKEQDTGRSLSPPDQRPGLPASLITRSIQDGEVMAIKEPIKRTRTKRTATPT